MPYYSHLNKGILLLVEIVILISYTRIIKSHAYFAFYLPLYISFSLFDLFVGTVCVRRTYTTNQTRNIHWLNQRPFLRSNLWFCCSVKFFAYILQFLSLRRNVMFFPLFQVNSKPTKNIVHFHEYTRMTICIYTVE